MNEKLMKRLRHNHEKIQDATIKQLLADVLVEMEKGPYKAAGMAIAEAGEVASNATLLAVEAVVKDSEEKLEAMEALTFKSIEATRLMPKGRLPNFMHRVDSNVGPSLSIKLPGDRDTYVIRSRECINAQKELRKSADASATRNQDSGGSST